MVARRSLDCLRPRPQPRQRHLGDRLTETGGWPTWWPDSERLAYLVNNPQGRQEFRTIGLEGGEPEPLGPGSVAVNNPLGISPDGRYLSYCDDVPVSSEIWMLQTSTVPGVEAGP